MPKKNTNSTQVALLTKAIKCDDPKAAQLLVRRALDVGNEPGHSDWRGVDEATIEEVFSLIKGLNPTDTTEMILATQFVSTHLKAMAKLASTSVLDDSPGMMLMRLSHQALDMLQKYRNKGSNINVNYFVKNEGQTLIQTNIGKNLEKKGG